MYSKAFLKNFFFFLHLFLIVLVEFLNSKSGHKALLYVLSRVKTNKDRNNIHLSSKLTAFGESGHL